MPAPTKPVSREYRIYLALWRRALTSPEELRIKCSSFSMAIAMRQGMYRAIRPFRNGQMNDAQLLKAAELFVVYLEKAPTTSEPHFLILKSRKALAELDGMFDELGIDEEDLLFGDERTSTEKLREFLDEQTAKPPKATPFYTRES